MSRFGSTMQCESVDTFPSRVSRAYLGDTTIGEGSRVGPRLPTAKMQAPSLAALWILGPRARAPHLASSVLRAPKVPALECATKTGVGAALQGHERMFSRQHRKRPPPAVPASGEGPAPRRSSVRFARLLGL